MKPGHVHEGILNVSKDSQVGKVSSSNINVRHHTLWIWRLKKGTKEKRFLLKLNCLLPLVVKLNCFCVILICGGAWALLRTKRPLTNNHLMAIPATYGAHDLTDVDFARPISRLPWTQPLFNLLCPFPMPGTNGIVLSKIFCLWSRKSWN